MLDERQFSELVVRECASVLLAVKPASMFTLRAPCAVSCPAHEGRPNASRCVQGAVPNHDEVVEARARVTCLVRCADGEMAQSGVRATVLAWRPFGAIVYVYRPDLLLAHLADERIGLRLSALGYAVPETFEVGGHSLDALLEDVRRRFGECLVPHEIGFFLGYPYGDVMGFIENEGRGFVCLGCWKAYTDARGSYRRFARYKRCARRCRMLHRQGMTLGDLASWPADVRRLRSSGAWERGRTAASA